jgi:hypothetical protein
VWKGVEDVKIYVQQELLNMLEILELILETVIVDVAVVALS